MDHYYDKPDYIGWYPLLCYLGYPDMTTSVNPQVCTVINLSGHFDSYYISKTLQKELPEGVTVKFNPHGLLDGIGLRFCINDTIHEFYIHPHLETSNLKSPHAYVKIKAGSFFYQQNPVIFDSFKDGELTESGLYNVYAYDPQIGTLLLNKRGVNPPTEKKAKSSNGKVGIQGSGFFYNSVYAAPPITQLIDDPAQ